MVLIGSVEIPTEYMKTLHKCPYVTCTLPTRILGVIRAWDEFTDGNETTVYSASPSHFLVVTSVVFN